MFVGDHRHDCDWIRSDILSHGHFTRRCDASVHRLFMYLDLHSSIPVDIARVVVRVDSNRRSQEHKDWASVDSGRAIDRVDGQHCVRLDRRTLLFDGGLAGLHSVSSVGWTPTFYA